MALRCICQLKMLLIFGALSRSVINCHTFRRGKNCQKNEWVKTKSSRLEIYLIWFEQCILQFRKAWLYEGYITIFPPPVFFFFFFFFINVGHRIISCCFFLVSRSSKVIFFLAHRKQNRRPVSSVGIAPVCCAGGPGSNLGRTTNQVLK